MASLQAKTAFFDKLKPLYSDDEFDTEEQGERKRCRRFFSIKPASKSSSREDRVVLDLTGDSSQRPRGKPRRGRSAPTVALAGSSKIIKGTPMTALTQKTKLGALLDAKSDEVILVDDTPIPDSTRPIQRGRQRSGSTPLFPSNRHLASAREDSPSLNPSMRKRRREPSLNLRPDDEQIFKDLSFYYVPDDDVAPARRLRITKAREFGATWARSPSVATHIVVEKHIHFKDLGGVLKKTNKNLAPKVVNEDYPIDCIQFKALLECTQKKYQLTGQPIANETDKFSKIPSSSGDSTRSLQLNPPQNNPKRWDYVPAPGTPDRSEQSSHQVQGASETIPADSQLVILDLEGMASPPLDVSDYEMAASQEATEKGPTSGQDTDNLDGDAANKAWTEDGHKDELSEYIKLMLEYKGLPLDVEEEDAQTVVEMGGAESDGQHHSVSEDEMVQTRKSMRNTRSGRKDITFQDRFACNSAGAKDAKAGNPNARTIHVLQSMADYYDRINDHWRTTAYRKVISTLKRQETKVTTAEEAHRLPSIGPRLAQKIEEIVTTDRLQRLEYAQKEPMDEALQLFLGIYGVGNSLAQQWLAQGYRTLDDLKGKAKLTPNQLVGVDHYEDLNTRIPRREVEALGAVVRRGARQVDPELDLTIGGSYRRGAESSGDIDFIVSKPNTESSTELKPFLDALVQRLETEGFLVARLASSRSVSDGSKWHGCCVLPRISGFNDENYRPVWRRIDFLLVPESEMGAALIYFTGNDIFNRSMRLLASKKGMRLNQRGLYRDVMRGPQRVRVTEGELVEGRNERRIFEILGVKWREPHERWC
ncbi:hypothetical protein ACJ41O_002592 [Fusarium nematophilum]